MFLTCERVQALECKPMWNSIGHYLVHGRFVVQAKVKRITRREIIIEVLDYVKPSAIDKKYLRLNYYFSVGDSNDVNINEVFEEGEQYIVFAGLRRYTPLSYVYREPCNRFRIESDSLCIGYQFLEKLVDVDSSMHEDIYQKNPFEDSLMPYGYKISLKDFKELVLDVNRSFIPSHVPNGVEVRDYSRRSTRPKKRKDRVYGYTYWESKVKDKFTLAIIADLKLSWGL